MDINHRRPLFFLLLLALVAGTATLVAQAPAIDWSRVETESMEHFQAVLRFDTSDPPGNERPAAEYLKQVLEREGIATKVFELEPNRLNVVARLKGNGKKRPLLLMGHTDTVNVDPAKWTFPPFSATRNGGYVYGRGTVDDKDNVTAALMTMLLLKRSGVALDRDVIFLAEAGEEGTTRVGIQFMAQQHFDEIDAEYCLAEGGSVVRSDGRVRYAAVADRGEDSAWDPLDGDRHRRPRLGAAPDEFNSQAREGGADRRRMEAANPAQRHDADLFHAAGRHFAAGRRGAVSRGDRQRPQSRAGSRGLFRQGDSGVGVERQKLDFAQHHSGRISHQRDPV